jgi:hypothetical protein
MKIKFNLIFPIPALLIAFLLAGSMQTLYAEQEKRKPSEKDSLKTYWLEPVVVHGKRTQPGEKTANLQSESIENAMDDLGIQTVRRGVSLCSDISVGGFSRGDIDILIDGEYHPPACPNRMDNASTRLNFAEMESMELSRCCSSASCGLGGMVEYHRKEPGEATTLSLDTRISAIAANEQELQLAFQSKGWRLSARGLSGAGFENGDGDGFVDRYGYSNDADYGFADVSLNSKHGKLESGFNWSTNSDIPFPYLMMDEIESEHFAGYLSWAGNKAYYNQTSHLMDNSLRTNSAGVPNPAATMISDAENTTLGLSGGWYHVYWYHWNLDNVFPMAGIDNHMIPDLDQYSASFQHSFALPAAWALSARAGIVIDKAGNKDQIDSMQGLLYDNPDNQLVFPAFGLALQKSFKAGAFHSALMLETASDDPALENLWISVQKPMGKPWWIGNPELSIATRNTLRARITGPHFAFESSISAVNNYSNLRKTSINDGAIKIQTYENIDARIADFNLQLYYGWLRSDLSMNFGQDITRDEALAEMNPLQIVTSLSIPLAKFGKSKMMPQKLWFSHTWTASQNRVSSALNELETAGWNRVDLGVRGFLGQVYYDLELQNTFNTQYRHHLSYARNPFSAGIPVDEAGMSVNLRLGYEFQF